MLLHCNSKWEKEKKGYYMCPEKKKKKKKKERPSRGKARKALARDAIFLGDTHKIAKLQSCKIAKLLSCKVAKLQSHNVTLLQS
ncbi:hypothetical protein POVWA1_012210 [Plasmodium ovale wallikeri]|uniref:Uncharacterized protein n=1 Tax=Plasmodium ovale wallikeri TaxID=864142 RepID=A0A1A8YLR0_PLAOA|nr:hypothetical protein POVWA1_012210 [Plasmodium ovale wallikeri]